MQAATDEIVLEQARYDGTILARSGAASPSVLLIRRLAGRRAGEQSAIIQVNLPEVASDLAAGAVVVLGDEWIRIRRLPMPG